MRRWFLFFATARTVEAYAKWWHSCEPPRMGARVMRREVLPPSKSHGAAVLVQPINVDDPALPSVSVLRELGNSVVSQMPRESPVENQEDTEEEGSFDAVDLWHEGLTEWLRHSTENATAELALHGSDRGWPWQSLLVWPRFGPDAHYQMVIAASSGTLEPLPSESLMLAKSPGGLLDPAIEAEDGANDTAQPLDDDESDFYRLQIDDLFDVRCGGRLAAMVSSMPSRMTPPLLWRPGANETGSHRGVAFVVAYAGGRQVRRADLHLGSVSDVPFDQLVEHELDDDWDLDFQDSEIATAEL